MKRALPQMNKASGEFKATRPEAFVDGWN